MSRTNVSRSGRVLLAAALAGAGLAAAIVTQSGGAATQDTTTTTTATTTAATTTAATTTAATTTTATTTTAAAPSNTSPPTISGTPAAGSTLTAQPGSWSGSATITYTYQWLRCSSTGGSCAAVSGATSQTYALGSADVGNTVRVEVTARNGAGSATAQSVPSAVVAAAATTTTAPAPAGNGCPSAPKGQVVPVAQVAAPARLSISGFQSNPGRLTGQTTSFTMKIVVGDGCGHPVQGALVYATAVPFSQFDVPGEQATGSDGSATLTFHRGPAFPASRRQELLALFLRARKPGDDTLGGISTRQLVSVPVSLR